MVKETSDYDTKEITSCMNCPMRVDMGRSSAFAIEHGIPPSGGNICAHWGSPESNTLHPYGTPPEWCPIEKKPLLFKVVRYLVE